MNDLSAMKGSGRSIVSLISGTEELDLVEFLDGSIGIEKNKKSIGIWECGEKDDCLNLFVAMAKDINPSGNQLLIAMMGKKSSQRGLAVTSLN